MQPDRKGRVTNVNWATQSLPTWSAKTPHCHQYKSKCRDLIGRQHAACFRPKK